MLPTDSSIKTVVLPPSSQADPDGSITGGWWHQAETESGQEPRIICDLCPRECNMKPGDRGFCFVRKNIDGQMRLTTYGRSTGFCIDPIEKKPLNHFYPGTPVLSFGTAGCNLGCKFCQNWDISKSRQVDKLSELAMPDMIAQAALQTACKSVAFTYNDPIIWAEYAIDTAKACRSIGIKSVAVTAGYISPAARPAFFHSMDAANVDLKAFTEEFYEQITYSNLQPVLDTLHWLKHESDVWFEITNLIIPDTNDSTDELRQMCEWILKSVGPDVPVHFSAFHPDFRMTDKNRTSHETLLKAKDIAENQGIRFAYVGNVHDVKNQSTWCPKCGGLLIERDWHQLGKYSLNGNLCGRCQTRIPGHFDQQPGTWGRKRLPLQISRFQNINSVEQSDLVQLNTPVQLQTTAQQGKTMSEVTTASPDMTEIQEASIHRAASQIIAASVNSHAADPDDTSLQGAADFTVMGAFVTLKRNGQLRGCCGSVGAPMPLLKAVTESARRTATEDSRFPPVSATELPHLTIDVTLLYQFEVIEQLGVDRIKEIEVGKHGIRVAMAGKSGLFLPVVATEQNWTAQTFLEQVCRKAGLPTNAWQHPDCVLTRFEGRMIERPIDASVVSESSRPTPFTQQQVDTLATFAQSNILAQFQGAVPGCFPQSVSDGTVDGIALRVSFRSSDQNGTFSQIQMRNGYPLQTTLLNLTQAAAQWLRSNPAAQQQAGQIKADVILLTDPAMHGTVDSMDLKGIIPADRMVMVREGQKMAWNFSSASSPQDLVNSVTSLAKVSMPKATQVFSFAAVSSAADFSNSNVPQPSLGNDVRKPAVAGRFYPSAPGALAAILKKCLGVVPSTKADWPAVMIPHAGLQYSGQVAADALKQINIPETVIVIGPKHTPLGVDWAVAPHTAWDLPNGTMPGDKTLAERMADRIDGLELDAAAHAQEHSIEMALPLLYELSPKTKVVGVVMGSSNLKRCITFGQQLALLISEMETAPLLIISSDMNHFAEDEENRRLDEMALAAVESMNPQTLFDTVRNNSISMCGVLPAVVVMETLLSIDQLDKTERTGYATSADVTDDKSRVVGYSGMLLG